MVPQPRVETTCQECGKAFMVYPWRLAKGGGKFCSNTCYAQARQGAKRDTSGWVYGSEERACKVCGALFRVGGRDGKSRDTTTCSRECMLLSRYRRGSAAKSLTETQSAYLAGVIDGEGSIILYMRRDVVAMRMGIANCHKPLLDWALATTGTGNVYDGHAAGPQRRASYEWRCNGESAESLLRQMLPYMIVKAEQARLAIETQERLRDPKLKADRSWHDPYRQRMKALNQRGPRAD